MNTTTLPPLRWEAEDDTCHNAWIVGGNGDGYHVVELDEERWSVLLVACNRFGDDEGRDIRLGHATNLQQAQAVAEAHYYRRHLQGETPMS